MPQKHYSNNTNIFENIELLSPAGCIDSVHAAVNCGCDAIYLGGKSFNARNAANNFNTEDICNVIDYCHLRKTKVYITVNTLYNDKELPDLFDFVAKMYSFGADAFIVQDIGAAMMIKKHMPHIHLHASTQMTAHSLHDVLFMESIGFDRVVLSRELSAEEISFIKQNSTVELEAFVHGALCYCFSGQCLMSSFMGGRSGNKGKCAQPCRLQYSLINNDEVVKTGHLLSPKDIMTMDVLDKIINAGISTLKIEGRLKSAEYVALATKAYKQAIQALISGGTQDNSVLKKKLTQIFNRGGFSQGYYDSFSGIDMMSIDTPKNIGLYLGKVQSYHPSTGKCLITIDEPLVPGDGIEIWTKSKPHVGTGISKSHNPGETITVLIKGDINPGDAVYKSMDKALLDEAKSMFVKDERKTDVIGFAKVKAGEAIYLRLTHPKTGITAESTGSIAETASNQPMTAEKIIAQLSKTGATPFAVNFEEWEIGNNVFVPIAELNSLRRTAIQQLEEKIIASYKRPLPQITMPNYENDDDERLASQITVLVTTREQMDAVLSVDGISIIYLELINDEIIGLIDDYSKACNERGIKLFASLPHIDRDEDGMIKTLEASNIQGYLIRTFGQLFMLKDTKKAIHLDYTFNKTNKLSYSFMKKYASLITLSPELPLSDIDNMCPTVGEIVIYGKQKLMATAQCPIGIYAAQKNEQRFCRLKNNTSPYFLLDRKNVKMPIITNCRQCIAYIYNDRPTSMLLKIDDLRKSHVQSFRLSFTDETAQETKDVLTKTVNGFNHGKSVSFEDPFTYGHFFKGSI